MTEYQNIYIKKLSILNGEIDTANVKISNLDINLKTLHNTYLKTSDNNCDTIEDRFNQTLSKLIGNIGKKSKENNEFKSDSILDKNDVNSHKLS